MKFSDNDDPEIASKRQFAALMNVSPARVSQWISEKKIDGDALIGDGRSAAINVAVAKAQLRDRLSLPHRVGNGAHTRLAIDPKSVFVKRSSSLDVCSKPYRPLDFPVGRTKPPIPDRC